MLGQSIHPDEDSRNWFDGSDRTTRTSTPVTNRRIYRLRCSTARSASVRFLTVAVPFRERLGFSLKIPGINFLRLQLAKIDRPEKASPYRGCGNFVNRVCERPRPPQTDFPKIAVGITASLVDCNNQL